MPDRRLYTLPIPSDAQTETRSQQRRNLQSQAAVEGDGTVESVSLEPGDRVLQGSYRARYAEAMAEELEQLFRAPGVEAVPYYGDGIRTSADGYYALSDVSIQPSDPRADIATRFDGVLRKKGTRRTHYRALETQPTTVDNDFGNGTTGEIAVPASASKVQWYDGVSTTEAATVQATRTGSAGDVDVYDTEDSSFDAPTLFYEIDYADESVASTHVYDDREADDETDDDGAVQWDHVFVADWEPRGKLRFDNGLLRLTFDEANQSLTAAEYSGDSWSDVSLGDSDWQLWDVDLRRNGFARLDARVTFEDTSDSSTYTLAMTLHRGQRGVQWARLPDASESTPDGLQTKLDPVATTSVIDPQAVHSLVKRAEVRT